jgi:hypothetical protein
MTLRDRLRGATHTHAPSLDDADTWLNSPPLRAADLRGNVVAYDFWTYTCVNWLRTLPYLRAWWHRYREHGLVVVGVHSPEFGFEHGLENVREAVQMLDVDYPVVIDNDFEIWRSFDNHYWPALYVADADGAIRHTHFGEGGYEEGERAIQELLAESGRSVPQGLVHVSPAGVEVAADWGHLGSPESYLGSARGDRFVAARGDRGYVVPESLRLNEWALGGDWDVRRDAVSLETGPGTLAYRFRARDVNLVLASEAGTIPFRVTVDGNPPGRAHGVDCSEDGRGVLSSPRLYQLVRLPDRATEGTFAITFETSGATGYVFTFG